MSPSANRCDVLVSLAYGEVHISQSVGDVHISQSACDIPVSQSHYDFCVSQSDYDVCDSQPDYDVCVSQSDKVPVSESCGDSSVSQSDSSVLLWQKQVIITVYVDILVISHLTIIQQCGHGRRKWFQNLVYLSLFNHQSTLTHMYLLMFIIETWGVQFVTFFLICYDFSLTRMNKKNKKGQIKLKTGLWS